ncbi:MAG: glycosyltransferase [Proteobacteria bacterium]|nr:glycosyltransferase [Pseudomonadota bacterium]
MKKLLTSLAFLAAMIAIIVYAIVRIAFTMILAPEHVWTEQLFAGMLLAGEMFILVHALGYAAALLRSSTGRQADLGRHHPLTFPPPAVAVLVAARHEPKEVLEQTFRSLVNLSYPNKTVYFLDDSSDEKYMREAEELCEKFNLTLFRRSERRGAKAGIVNDCLSALDQRYVAIFDADQRPIQGFLTTIIPMLESDEGLAFVQTPQYYSNMEESHVAKGATYQQSVFYEYICEAKGSNQSMFCCGTNVAFRREALLSVGGFDESVVTEDFATSLKLHTAGWRSLYYNHVSTFGMGPQMLAAYFKQQDRWARGTVGVLRRVVAQFIRSPASLSIGQWWEYLLSSSYYLIGLAFLFLMACPIAYIFFNVPSFFIHMDIYFSVFIPYITLSLAVFFFTLRARSYRLKQLFIGQLLTYISIPVYVRATLLGLAGVQGKFGITLKGKGTRMSFLSLWPQIVIMFLNFAALAWGINRFFYERDLSVLVNCFWVTYHFLVMNAIFYFNEELHLEVDGAAS